MGPWAQVLKLKTLARVARNQYYQVMRSSSPKYRQIYQTLRAAIDGGVYTSGARLPSEHEMVKSFGASRITVSRALQELRAQGYVDRRAGSGTYVRASAVNQHTFGLLIPDLGQTEIFEPICQGMASVQHPQNHDLIWGKTLSSSDTTEAQAQEVCRRLITKQVSGVFFAPLEASPHKDAINEMIGDMLSAAGIPIVLLDRDIYDYPRRSRFDVVGIDNRRAGFVATQHLISLGCQRIAFIARRYSAPSCIARANGYRDAVASAEGRVASALVEHFDASDKIRVAEVMKTYRPDGIVCSNDRSAAVLMRTLTDLGILVPDNVRLVAFDDVKYAKLVTVPLTTVRQPCDQIGAAASQAMIQRIENPGMPPRDILVDFQLVVRESCGSNLREPALVGANVM